MLTAQAGKPTLLQRRLVERLVLTLIAVLALQTWYVEGLLVPMKVTSGSMALALLGPHQSLVCDDCRMPFSCGIDAKLGPRLVCPNCGYAANSLPSLPDTPGDCLLVSRPVLQLRSPRRWELVAFRHPESASQIVLKRVVGLPGESVEIRDGEVYADGVLQRKPWAQQKALAVLVYDANHPPNDSTLPPRWQGDGNDSQWTRVAGRFAHPATDNASSIDWLSYHHWCRLPGQPGKVQACPITNTSGYNQGFSQRSETVHPVTDVLLSFRLQKMVGKGELLVMLTDGRRRFQVRFNGGVVGSQIDVALVDRQLTVALNNRVVLQRIDTSPEAPPAVTTQPAAIGVRGLGVEITDLRLWRDVYYTRPIGPGARWGVDQPYRLQAGQYFVLGDNSPISLDSRTWVTAPVVSEDLLVGKPFLVSLPTRRTRWGGRCFLVPEFHRIRYIR